MAPKPQVPENLKYFNPVLAALAALGGSATIGEMNARVASDMKLSDKVLAVPHDREHGGQSEVAYRIAWARTYLKLGGLITNSERGVWALTPAGTNAGRIDEKAFIKEVRTGIRKRKKPKDEPGDDRNSPGEANDGATGWKHALLETLHAMNPSAFERLCRRLLREAGFVDVQVTGGTGDKGVDGVGLLRLQEVLTFRVIFQCKRLRSAVDPSTVRDFRGAMTGRSDKGLIITTSYFTREAIREATRDGAPAIDLIDGEQLVALLRKLGLGVKTEMVERVTIEPEWFRDL